jgi:hypothetical protein
MMAHKPAVRNGARHPVASKSERRLSDVAHASTRSVDDHSAIGREAVAGDELRIFAGEE